MIEDVVSEFDKKRIQELLPKIDFTFSPITTSEKFPANFHILVSRPDNDSLIKETLIIYLDMIRGIHIMIFLMIIW